jgi:hypothetical protein
MARQVVVARLQLGEARYDTTAFRGSGVENLRDAMKVYAENRLS